MFDIKNSKVLLGRYVNKKVDTVEWDALKRGDFDHKYCTCDCVASYRTTEDVKVGDMFTVYHKGLLCTMIVDVIVPRVEYSNARYFAGEFDTMSTPISKIDLDGHKERKERRIKIKNMKAAMEEILAKAEEEKRISDAIKALGKDKGAELADLVEGIEALEAEDVK